MSKQSSTAWIVLYDFPASTKGSTSKFYRRLAELLRDQGGNAQCRATKSAYVIDGDGAQSLAYAIGALASAFGAGAIGEQDGVVVLPLGNIEPRAHFDSIKRATASVQNLTVDRRTVNGKKSPRCIDTPVSMQSSDDKIIDLAKTLREQRAKVVGK